MQTDRGIEKYNPLRWWALTAAALGIFMVALDSSIVNVALPTLGESFKSTAHIQWVALSYTLTLVAVIVAAGRMSDMFGRKIAFLTGIGIFLLGSILCGTASSLALMIVYRVVQGIGGAFIAAPIAAVATVMFPIYERGKAMGIVGIIGPLGGLIGPSVGGFLIDAWGWRSVFYINIPVGILSFLLLKKLLPVDSEYKKTRFDTWGSLSLAFASLFLLLGLSSTIHGYSTVQEFILSAILFTAFLLIERKVQSPMIPVPLMKQTTFTMPLLGILSTSIVGAGLGFLNPFFLQYKIGMSPSQIGLVILFYSLGMAIAAQLSGLITDKLGTKLSSGIGAFIGIVGLFLYTPLNSHWTIGTVMWHLFFIGFGSGMFTTPTNVAIMSATPHEFVGMSSAISNMARNLGFALGPTIATVFWTPGMASSIGAMRTVVYALIVVQFVAWISSVGYLNKDGRTRKWIWDLRKRSS
ncbi:MFS transporter [Paenibacillus sediminis]|uniref:EmrB/QacA subfamily drug resistance transporter n=1 Tax=Paenibacillus sediminis TaxID=664909 RepID=A0ABS4H6H3_9BACL|nr:MFS transporter [Paenibacillus sediminis]MBP1938081.1 EmrB/QacA subfamily drug resistance transporter [Paenibacillus sediminis]